MSGRPLLIAHRAGNDPARAREACRAGADLVELDVHLRGSRLEVRHAHRLGPLLRDGVRLRLARRADPELEEVLAGIDAGVEPMLDLKDGPATMAIPVLAAARRARGGRPVTISARRPELLAPLVGEADVRAVHSAARPREVEALRRAVSDGGVGGACVRRDRLDADLAAELRAGAGVLMTWPVADAADAACLRDWGVNGLICDDLALVAALRLRRG